MLISFRRATKCFVIVLGVMMTNFLLCYLIPENVAGRRSERQDILSDEDNGRYGGVQLPKRIDNKPEFSRPGWNEQVAKQRPNVAKNDLGNANFDSTRRETDISDVFISVKTTGRNHQSRLRILLDTWILLAREQTHIFTDTDDPGLSNESGVEIINTKCLPAHTRQALCCKMAIEYDTFLASKKRWFCHVDDDNYVNIPQLVKLLRQYNHTQDWYLGKPSLRKPIEIVDRKHIGQKVAFWFATGGAGICISKGLALKMMPYASGGRLMTIGESIRLPDDCTIGYIISHLMKKQLTVIEQFHSHLESLNLVSKRDLVNQIMYSYRTEGNTNNVLNIDGFNTEQDPTRLWSLHCFLFPTFHECSRLGS